jgi:hypothetical protein
MDNFQDTVGRENAERERLIESFGSSSMARRRYQTDIAMVSTRVFRRACMAEILGFPQAQC